MVGQGMVGQGRVMTMSSTSPVTSMTISPVSSGLKVVRKGTKGG